jgi:acetyl esterase/lipase
MDSDIDTVRAMLAGMGFKERPVDVARSRIEIDEMGAQSPSPPGWRSETLDLGRPAARWSGPETKPGRTILYLHGGGYCVGSLKSHGPMIAALAQAAACEAIALDYRLAPENPYPAAVDDSVAAYRRLLAEGRPARSIALMGDSAGGGLALATAVRAKAEGLATPLAIVALSPWTDLSQSGASYAERGEADPILAKPHLDAYAKYYLGAASPREPYASPLFADLAGLPPVLIQVGGDEVLLSDSEAFIANARAAGVDATVEIWPGLFHVWHFFFATLEESREAISEIGAWLKRRWTS